MSGPVTIINLRGFEWRLKLLALECSFMMF